MKQTQLKEDSHKCPDMKGRILSLYKEEVLKYKQDIVSGKIKAPVFKEAEKPISKEPIKTEYNEIKETEQTRLEVK